MPTLKGLYVNDFNTILGNVSQDANLQPLTSQFHLWLLQYEFSETILMIRKGQPAHFLTSKRKQQLIQSMKLDEEVKVTQKEVETNKELFDANFKQFLKGTDLTKVATFKKENV